MSPEIVQMLLFAAIGLVFWLLILRPQTKKIRDEQTFKLGVQEGEKVVTTGGIHGKVIAADDFTVTINIGKGNNVRVERSAISMDMTNALRDRKSKS